MGVPVAPITTGPAASVPTWDVEALSRVKEPSSAPASPRRAQREREPSMEVVEGGS